MPETSGAGLLRRYIVAQQGILIAQMEFPSATTGCGQLILPLRLGGLNRAFNIEHETEWEDNLHEVEGELGASFGLARDLGKRWALGLEFRNENILPEYKSWESSALFLGPVISYREEKWWAALTVMPQIYGWNNSESQDSDSQLELNDHEKINIRLLIGFNF